MINSEDVANERAHKTWRIVILSTLVLVIACLTFAFKIDACTKMKDTCRDEFFEIKTDDTSSHACAPGAIVEIVNSPPAPRPGIICHCPSNGMVSSQPANK